MKKQIPNIITLCNLFCGAVATYYAAFGRLEEAALFILLGIVFDFFDGMAARLLKVPSELGKELDSLADVVTSGVAPGFILFNILWNHSSSILIKFVAFLIPVFAAYRLAKFNLDERQHTSFRGLPAPANALIWVGIGLLFYESNVGFNLLSTPWWMNDEFFEVLAPVWSDGGYLCLAILSVITDLLMISDMRMFSLKFNFKDLSWKNNWARYIFLVVCLGLIIAFGFLSFTLLIIWYIIWSLCTQRKESENE